MLTRLAGLAALLMGLCGLGTLAAAQEPVALSRHPVIASTWTASYSYDCGEVRPAFDLSVRAGQPSVSNFDFGSGPDQATDRAISEALADQTFTDISVACGMDGLGTSVVFRTGKTATDGSYIPAWVRVTSATAPAKATVTAGQAAE